MKNLIRSVSGSGVGGAVILRIALIAFTNAAAASTLYMNQYILHSVTKDFPVTACTYALPGATFAGYAAGVFLATFARVKRMSISEPAHLAILAAALATAAAAVNVLTLLVSSVLIGVGAAVIPRLLAAAPGSVAPRARRLVIGWVVSTTLIGIMGARIIVAPLSEVFGWRPVFLISGISIGVLGVLLALVVSKRTAKITDQHQTASAPTLWRSYPQLRRATLNQAVLFAVFNISWMTVFAESRAEDASSVTVMAGATGVAAAWLTGRLPPGRDYRNVRIVATAAIVLAEAIALPIAYSTSSIQLRYGLLAIGMSLVELSMQSGLVSNQALVQELDPTARSRLSAMLTTAGSAGGAAGAAVASCLLQLTGWTSAIGLAAALSLISLFCARTRPYDVLTSVGNGLTEIREQV